MWKQLMYKWFGLTDAPCETCEILRMQLAESNAERKDLLRRLLEPKQVEPPSLESEAPVPITSQHVPWRVRQQMLEAEDRERARLIRESAKRATTPASTEQIADLEKELGVQ